MGPDDAAWAVPLSFMLMLGAVLFFFFYYRYKTQSAMQQTIQTALEKGQELSPELIEHLAGPKGGPGRDLRRGMIAIAIGVGFAVLGVAVGEPDAIGPMLGVGSFPFLVGVAYLLMWRYGDREK